MKVCTKCGEAKSINEFHKDSSKNDGLRVHCKVCVLNSNKNWRLNNCHYESERYRADKKAARARNDSWRAANPDKVKHNRNSWRRSNPSKVNVWNSRRRAAKLNATPSWITAIHKAQIQEFYDLALAKTTQTGVQYQVDHIHPLQGDALSGLHVPWNLQIITASENASKCNRVQK